MKNALKKELNKRRTDAQNLAEKNLAKALSAPKFKELYQKEQEIIIKNAKLEAFNENIDNSSLLQIKKEQDLELNKIGLKRQDLVPSYTCKKCDDTGIYENKPCDCTKKIISEILLKKSGFSSSPKTFADSNFDIFSNPENAKLLYLKMQTWCNKNSKIKNILLSGDTGTGKTFLLECMLSELINNSRYVYYTTAFNLSQKLLKYHTSFEKEKESILEELLTCDYLIIDDLGSEPIYKNVSEEYLYLIINERQISEKPIIISTNLDPEKIQSRYGERIFSRLMNKRVSLLLKLEEDDLRLKR